MRLLASFSGGKDSILSIDRAIKDNEIVGLITTFNGSQSWFHEIDGECMDKISNSLNIPLFKIQTGTGDNYTKDFVKELKNIKRKTRSDGIIFGDIDLESHKKWCESLAEQSELIPVFPLWNENRRDLVFEFLKKGYRTVIKKVDKTKLPKSYLGKILDEDLVSEFDKLGIDISGENGEYHTVVFDGPIFSKTIDYSLSDVYADDWSHIIKIKT